MLKNSPFGEGHETTQELFALVGGHTPDLRGLFLRGHGSHTSTHYGTVTHKSAELGQVQGDAIREIWGAFLN